MGGESPDELLARCQKFVFEEAALLDAGELESWLGLFDDECAYWLPIDTTRDEPHGGLNLIFDDRRRLEDRIWRLRSGNAHTEEPPSRTVHIITNLRLIEPDPSAGIVELRGTMVVMRSRLGERVDFPARVSWLLRSLGDTFRIRQKRIDLLDADQPMPALTFLL